MLEEYAAVAGLRHTLQNNLLLITKCQLCDARHHGDVFLVVFRSRL